MKQQKFFVIVMTVCALLLSLAGCASSSAFDGSSAKNADSYHLDVKIMNGTDTHTLELKQGDTLKILFETVKGSLEMKITSPDGTSLYQADGTYMDRIERRFTYNGTDTWIDEDGAEWKLLVLKM